MHFVLDGMNLVKDSQTDLCKGTCHFDIQYFKLFELFIKYFKSYTFISQKVFEHKIFLLIETGKTRTSWWTLLAGYTR